MKAIYHIDGLCPRTDIDMGRAGFCIHLHPLWREAVLGCPILNQESVNTAIKNMYRPWLDGCGYDAIFDPDRDPLDVWRNEKFGEKIKYSKNARPLYGEHSIRVQWGEWGPEHINVPGNACGLDIERSFCGGFKDGKSFVPHNVDTINQAHLILVIFTFFAGTLILNERA